MATGDLRCGWAHLGGERQHAQKWRSRPGCTITATWRRSNGDRDHARSRHDQVLLLSLQEWKRSNLTPHLAIWLCTSRWVISPASNPRPCRLHLSQLPSVSTWLGWLELQIATVPLRARCLGGSPFIAPSGYRAYAPLANRAQWRRSFSGRELRPSVSVDYSLSPLSASLSLQVPPPSSRG